MDVRNKALILVAAGSWNAASVGSPAKPETEMISAITGALLQADGPKAVELLNALPIEKLNSKDAGFRACALSRLNSRSPATLVRSPRTARRNPLAEQVLTLYRQYWRQSVMDLPDKDAAEEALRAKLIPLLRLRASASMTDVEKTLARSLKRDGLYSLEGRTGLLREFMLWGRQSERTYSVQLPEGMNHTRVFFMRKFSSLGWAKYLTCDRRGTGGWTKAEGLFVVTPAYPSLTDERFYVNFLAHESQHYLDHRQFPHLHEWELEYRAKLTELTYAQSTMGKTLQSFMSNQGDDPADAHSYANKHILAGIRTSLGLTDNADLTAVPVAKINEAARAQLFADSAVRRAGFAIGRKAEN